MKTMFQALLGSGHLSDGEWQVIAPLLPIEGGRGRTAGDSRVFFNGLLWVATTNSKWRELPCTYGNWNSVFRRYRRWTEARVFDNLLIILAEMAIPDLATEAFESVVVRAHRRTTGIVKALDRPRGCAPAEAYIIAIEEIVPLRISVISPAYTNCATVPGHLIAR